MSCRSRRPLVGKLLFLPWLLAVSLTPSGVGAQPLSAALVASGLQRPVFATAPRGDPDRLFVLEQEGFIRIVKNGALLPTPFLDIDSKVGCCGEMGLLGLAFHPQFRSNGYFYVNYLTFVRDLKTVVARYTVSATDPDRADPTSEQILLTIPQPYTGHNAGMIAFGPDGYLYIGVGDGGFPPGGPFGDPHNYSQNLGVLLGKMLRIDVNGGSPYAIPPSNPFVGQAGALPEIWAYGLRNPYRFSFDRMTGEMYIGDVGGAREEVDWEPAGFAGGRNYGWRCMAGTQCTFKPGCVCLSPAFTFPIHEYPPAGCTAIIGGYVYRGCAIPSLRGTYFYADYCAQRITSFRWDGIAVRQLTQRFTELSPAGEISRISSLGEDGNGELYICDLLDGEVFKIVPQTPTAAGLTQYGTGTPGCAGSGFHTLTGNCSPVLGNGTFQIDCDNAPPSTVAIVFLSSQPDLIGSDPFGVGLLLHVNLLSPTFFAGMASSPTGKGTLPLPIPLDPSLISGSLHCQAIWPWVPFGPCSPSAWNLSSSRGLTITIQP